MHWFTLNSLASCFCNIIMCLLIKFVFVVVVAVVVVNVPCFCVFLRDRNENAPRHWNGMPLIWSFYICHYKIAKIVRTLWLAERSVCMRVCKHGCGVKLFCFSHTNHASTNLKKCSSSKLDKFTLFTHSSISWNLENRYKEGVSVFFHLSPHFKREKSVFWKASFCKNKNWLRARLRVQDFATGKNFSFNQRHNKQFCIFFRESYFITAIENFFPVFA